MKLFDIIDYKRIYKLRAEGLPYFRNLSMANIVIDLETGRYIKHRSLNISGETKIASAEVLTLFNNVKECDYFRLDESNAIESSNSCGPYGIKISF